MCRRADRGELNATDTAPSPIKAGGSEGRAILKKIGGNDTWRFSNVTKHEKRKMT